MRILVTGGAGYVGTVLLKALLSKDHSVCCFDRRALQDQFLWDLPPEQRNRCHSIVGDIRDRTALRAACMGAGAVFHLAAIVGYPACDADPEEARSVNVAGTRALVGAVPPSVPLISLSTSSVYGRINGALCREEESVSPLTLYGVTKLHSEGLVLERGGIVLRPATAYGPSPCFRWDLLIHSFASLGLTGARLELFEPDAVRCFVNVGDIARAILFSLEHFDTMAAGIYNLGSSDATLSKIELATLISQFTGLKITIDQSGRDPDGRHHRMSFDRLERLGFHTEVLLRVGIAQTIDWIRGELRRKVV